MTITAGDWEVQTLEPLSWIDSHYVAAGISLNLSQVVDLAEMGMPDGLTGTVESVSDCPAIDAGPGRVVLTTVSHTNTYVFDLTLGDAAGATDTLGVTGYHKFYTEDRGWVTADSLTLGEQVRGDHGDVTVLSLARDIGTYRVYNMTVETDHVYYVGSLTALVHNQCPISGLSAAEAEQLTSRWAKSTYDSVEESVVDHAGRHGFGDDVAKYLRKAANLNKKGAFKGKPMEDGAVRWPRKNGEYLIERAGKIVSYGINR